MVDAVDVLFVDEAGQISLANVVAIARATGQPRPARRPAAARPAAPGHASAGRGSIGAGARPRRRTRRCRRRAACSSRQTWRLHPDLCDFTSEVFYDDRLEPEAHLGRQRLEAPATLGRRRRASLVDIATVGADNESPEEADAVAELARSIVEGGATLDRRERRRAPMTWDDILIVAPYNAQVGAIKRAACRRRRGSGPSTSSRARKRRSASTR